MDPITQPPAMVRWPRTLGDLLGGGGAGEAVIGLEYIGEFWAHNNTPFYVCELCHTQAGAQEMYVHVTQEGHRAACMSRRPEKPCIQGTWRALRQKEAYNQRQILAVPVHDNTSLPKHSEEPCNQGTWQAAEQRRKQMYDQRQIQVVGVTPNNETIEKYNSHGTRRNESYLIGLTSNDSYTGSSPAPNMESGWASSSGRASTTASSGQTHNVPSQELQEFQVESKQNKKNADDFASNEELFEYLKQFAISSEDDTTFLIKVTETFTRSLSQYRFKSLESPEAAVSPQDSYSTQRLNAASCAGHYTYTEYPPKTMLGQRPPIPTNAAYQADANRSLVSTKRTSAQISAYNPASVPAGPSPKEIVPACHSAQAIQARSNQKQTMGTHEPGTRCYLCGSHGHNDGDCPINAYTSLGPVPTIKESTGIPRRAVAEVENPKTLTDTGVYTIPTIHVSRRESVGGTSRKTANLAEDNASDEDKIKDIVRQSGHAINKTGHRHPYKCTVCGLPGHADKRCPSIGTANLAEANASEEDKIRAVMSQSAYEHDPVNSQKKKEMLTLPPGYTCYRCNKPGHHIKFCPTNGDKTIPTIPRMKKSAGIPRSFMVVVSDPNMKGAKLTSFGTYAIPAIDAAVYALEKPEDPAAADEKPAPAKHRIIASGIMSSHAHNLPPQ